MVIPDPSTAVPARAQRSATPVDPSLEWPGDDYASGSEDERSEELNTKQSSRGSSGQHLSSNQHTSYSDRGTGHRPTPDGPPPELPPRLPKEVVDAWNRPLSNNTTYDHTRHSRDNYESSKYEGRRQGNEPYTGDKRYLNPSEGRRRDSRDDKGSSYPKGGAEPDVQKRLRHSEDPRRSPHSREDKGAADHDRKHDPEGRQGAGGGGESRQQHGSSATRSYAVVVAEPSDPASRIQRELKPAAGEAAPGDASKGQGAPGPRRQPTPQSQTHPGGPPKPNDGSGQMVSQDRPGPDVAGGTPTPPNAPPPGLDVNTTQEGERHMLQHEINQGGSGRGFFNKIGNMLGGVSSSAPSDCRCKEHEHNIASMSGRLQYQHREISRLNHTSREQANKLQAADREIQHLREKLQFAMSDLNNVQRELEDAKALSDTRGKELMGSQAFLTKADTISVSEVVGLARTVNNEILQVAASLCDSFIPEDHMDVEETSQHLRAHVEKAIGPELTKLLADNPDKTAVNPLIAQIVVQALLCDHLVDGIERWYDGRSHSTEKNLTLIYNGIRQTENQAVSGRWRALTRAQLRPQIERWVEGFLNELGTIQRLAGWGLVNQDAGQNLLDKLEPIFKAAEKVRRAIGEQFTSADIEIAVSEPYTPFNPRELEDEWGDARNPSSAQDIVGGTTGIGLKRRVVHHDAKEVISYETILPPKVVLLSSLREIAEPPPPRPKGKKVSGGEGPRASGS